MPQPLWYDKERITQLPEKTEKGNEGMTAFIGEFLVELIKLVVLVGVSLLAIFCGKKLRDRKDAKAASEAQSDR